MKRTVSLVLVIFFAFSYALSFIGCSASRVHINSEIRACWVSSIGNMDFPSRKGLSAAQLRSEIDAILVNCKNMGLNTIYFQVRPNGDALYRSDIFPWSEYLSGKQGVAPDRGFDPLKYFVEKAHKNNVQLHAWINPYRIGTGKDVVKSLSKDNPAVQHPEYAIQSETGLYYDPGLPAVRTLILNGIKELVRNYDIDGIHFDDYFYPYDLSGFDDSDTYKKYGKGLSLADFRRNSVNELVRSAYYLIKGQDPNKEFGISPFGIWANKSTNEQGSNTSGMSSYSAIFSDSKKWVENGWVDYICPQVYWAFDHPKAPFGEIVDWWDSVCKKTDVKLYIGLAVYKVDTDEIGWDESDQIYRQLQYASKKSSYSGHCFFRYGILKENPLGVLDSVKAYYKENVQAVEKVDEIQPLDIKINTKLEINSPQNNAVFDSKYVSISGVTIPGQAVSVNGRAAIVSNDGYYSAYVPLKEGKNKITARSAGSEKTIYITRKEKEPAAQTIDVGSFYPNGELIHCSGDLIRFSVNAPKDFEIELKNDLLNIHLLPSEAEGVYEAIWQVPPIPDADKLLLTGFHLIWSDAKGNENTKAMDLKLTLSSATQESLQQLKEDSYIFDRSRDGSQADHQPLAQGSYIVPMAMEGSRILLKNGFWVEKEKQSSETVEIKETAGYDYETITIDTENALDYFVYGDANAVYLELVQGRANSIKAESGTIKLEIENETLETKTKLRISSKAEYDIAGYEIVPQKEKITVYLRLHSNKLRGKTILLDAGHGGTDSGALGPAGAGAPTESELNFQLMRYLKRELESAGAEVHLTRLDDSALSLQGRVDKTHRIAPDLFISLHHNSTDQTSNFNEVSRGLVLYSSPISKVLAEHLAQNLWAGVSEDAAVPTRFESLYVCRQTCCPAVLIEAGYLCNPLEYEQMCRADNAEKIAKNIVIGLKNYFVSVCS